MKLAALYSGGKDSTYAAYKAQQLGHEVSCLITVYPRSDNSHFLHYPNIWLTKLQAESMKVPQLIQPSKTIGTQEELNLIEKLLVQAKTDFAVDGLVHGGILSRYQKDRFDFLSDKLNLTTIAPIWQHQQRLHMQNIMEDGIEFVITSVSSDGLDSSWLGKSLSLKDLETLSDLSDKFGFNLSFEGGEAETTVLNCPMFCHRIKITKSRIHWDGYRGRFEIMDACLMK